MSHPDIKEHKRIGPETALELLEEVEAMIDGIDYGLARDLNADVIAVSPRIERIRALVIKARRELGQEGEKPIPS